MNANEQALARPGVDIRPSGWFVRRALIGLLILTLSIAGAAVLLYSSIDQAHDEARQTTEAGNN